ncbi:endosomal transmembrane epsin interactor 1 isoform X2 [Betta splendens]|uniref:Endosomal transmembrane epsin interactor 1 isoform X2 n=1 Tax=Betta splendens TaxID=158456 RepID=A0A6P7LA90_BETSP|nr:endosomal transmembrane epsin interactor 1 isoform X2 [Betta splendens]
MSLPVVLPGSCCAVIGTSHLADPTHRRRARGPPAPRAAGGVRRLPPRRPLLWLGLLQLLLGGSIVALSFEALSLSSLASVRNACPFWAGCSVVLLGAVGLTALRRPMPVLSEEGDVCYCCRMSRASRCATKIKLLKLHPGNSCSSTRVQLKNVLFVLCALNALTLAVCFMAAALRYLHIFYTETPSSSPCMDEPRTPAEEREEPAQIPDPEEFVAPAPPPSYFSTFSSSTPRFAYQMFYRPGTKGAEVCPLDPPPPYEAVTQEAEFTVGPTATSSGASVPGNVQTKLQPPPPPPPPPQQLTPILNCGRRVGSCRSSSDPVLMDLTAKVWSSCGAPHASPPQTTDSSTQTSQSTLTAQNQTQAQAQNQAQGGVTLRRGSRTPRRPRPSSMVDYQSYRHTQQLVRRILEQPAAQGLAPEVQELVDSIRSVLQSDQEHMDEAVCCASYIEQVFTESPMGPVHPDSQQQPGHRALHTFPGLLRRRPVLLHLRSCGDLSSFTCSSPEVLERGGNRRAGSRAGSHWDQTARPHSLIGVFKETIL